MKANRELTTTAALPAAPILIDLDRRHAALRKRAQEEAEKERGGADSYECRASRSAAEAIARSLIAFPAKSEEEAWAKVRIVRREYSWMGTTEILSERGRKDLVASILDDLFALA